jgi:HemY protein
VAGERLFGELTDVAGYGVAARRGLAELAVGRGNTASAISHAEAALQNSKKSPWPADFLFQRRVLSADWEGALAALDDGEKRGLVGAKTAARRRAVVLSARALQAERMMERASALELAQRAVKIAPGFAPAAVMAARLQAMIGKAWQAAGTLEAAWEANPHPALALAYKDLKASEDPSAQGRWLDGLIRLNPAHRESRILAVEQALATSDGVAAITALAPLLAERPTSRILALRAAAAKVSGDDTGAREWLAKGASAPREADWSDLDPNGSAFEYEDADWARLIESYGERGVLVHPRLERSDAERLVAPELASLTEAASPAIKAEIAGPAPSPDDPGLAAFDGLGPSDDMDGKKKSWLSF